MVTLYTFPACPYCADLKEKLTNEGIEFNDINIDLPENKEEFDKILDVSKAEEVPVIKIDNQLLIPNTSFKTINEAVQITKNILG